MQRYQFTFYLSFYKAIRRVPGKSARADVYDAICDYALNGALPDVSKMSAHAAIAFEAIQPNLEAGRRKAVSGSLGGSRKQNESKDKDNDKDNGKDKDKEKNKNKCSLYPPRSGGARAGKKPPVPYCSGRTAPLDEIEREALEAMLKEGGLRNA